MQKRKRRWGDRYDGYKLRKVDPFFVLIPHVMRSRVDSQVFFEEQIDIDDLEKYVRRKRQEGVKNCTMLTVIVAATARMLALRPGLNRFVAGKHIFARNILRISMAVKRNMTIDGEETTLVFEFKPADTLYDVSEQINRLITESKSAESEKNSTDKVAHLISHIPSFLISLVVGCVRNLDKLGFMPRAIYKASPFHSSVFVTDVGSLGINPVYHHLYEFGTTSVFIAMGKKKTENYLKPDGTVGQRRFLPIRFVLDERICDGFYYANAIRSFVKLLRTPELLEQPPESIPEDPLI